MWGESILVDSFENEGQWLDILVEYKEHRVVFSSLFVLDSSSALETIIQKAELASQYEEIILLVFNQVIVSLCI